MSLFRKPKKIQRRVFCADDEDDPGDDQPVPPPPPLISKTKKEKPLKTSLLSFADEEEEEEVFKVKKSKQSNRLAKKREKERRKPDGDESMKIDNIDDEEPKTTDNGKQKQKKVTLEGLILSGREALAAEGAGDISGESEREDEEEEGNRGFHAYRAEAVRAALAVGGHIPDAALIHAARKTRQKARELGEFVPVGGGGANMTAPTTCRSRLADDGSGDDEDDDRIEVHGLHLPSDKPKRGTAAAPTNEELDSEPDEWEEQQIKKAMPTIHDIGGAVPPAPPPPSCGPRPLQPPPASPAELRMALLKRLEHLQSERAATEALGRSASQRLSKAAALRQSRAEAAPRLAAAYRRAQAARGYLTDLVECLDEKMPTLEALEKRALALHRRRSDHLTERRRADQRDQAQDVMALTGSTGAHKPSSEDESRRRRAAEREGRRRARRAARPAGSHHLDGDSSDDELTQEDQLMFQREREEITAGSTALFADALAMWRSVRGVAARLARFRRAHPALYTAAYLPAFLPRLLAPYVRHQLVLWNPLADEDNEDYEKLDWYKCLMMYGVRAERLSSDSEASSDEADEEPVVSEETVREDPDLMLVPNLINKVVMPKLAELVEASWDPMSVRATMRLRNLVARFPPPLGRGGGVGGLSQGVGVDGPLPAYARLAAAMRARLTAAYHGDVFLPALPPHVMSGAGGVFWRRCVGVGVRLLRAALALAPPPHHLRPDDIVMAIIETLCIGAGATGGTWAALAASSLCAALPRGGGGVRGAREGRGLRGRAGRRLAKLAQLAITTLDKDNPLHFKALEQARTVIAEAGALD